MRSPLHPLYRTTAALSAIALLAVVPGCGSNERTAGDPEDSVSSCPVQPPSQAFPREGISLGLNPDWGARNLTDYAQILQFDPAAAVNFVGIPFDSNDEQNVLESAQQLKEAGAVLILTAEPHDGLAAVSQERIDDLVSLAAEVNSMGVPVLLRFAHEMNGSWYPWGQQPELYIDRFRAVAAAVQERAAGTQMLWAPNYGGGYPYPQHSTTGEPWTQLDPAADTDDDGQLSENDDPYAPYYPGDDVVDWVGLSIYHWGAAYPWGSNDVPEEGKFLDQLTGSYNGTAGDHRAVPNFYAEYAEARNKPLAIPGTAAFVTASADPDTALNIKRAWWSQLFAEDLPARFPQLRLINWFEWDKFEHDVSAVVPWALSTDAAVAAVFAEDLPEWIADASSVTPCALDGLAGPKD